MITQTIVGMWPDAPPPEEPYPSHEEEELLNRIAVAMQFVQVCNRHMGFKGFNAVTNERVDQDLHPAQEGAMRLACRLLGKYFAVAEEQTDGEAEEVDWQDGVQATADP